MKLLFLIIITFFSMSCEDTVKQKKMNVQNYTCSSVQLKSVSEETIVCSTTTHSSSWCFDQAKISICVYSNRINSK